MPLKNKIRTAFSRIFGSRNIAGGPVSLKDIDADVMNCLQQYSDYTMTSLERRFHLLMSIRYIARNKIEGAIVECGVWRGGSMMLAASELLALDDGSRELYMYDTYSGMPPPAGVDRDPDGIHAEDRLKNDSADRQSSNVWAIASLADVKANLDTTGYEGTKMRFIQGKVEDTIPETIPDQIALLRLDTDWYESTIHELIHLVPRVCRGGVIIIDDYGYWSGARKAVDEYIADSKEPILLNRIDDTGRSFIRLGT